MFFHVRIPWVCPSLGRHIDTCIKPHRIRISSSFKNRGCHAKLIRGISSLNNAEDMWCHQSIENREMKGSYFYTSAHHRPDFCRISKVNIPFCSRSFIEKECQIAFYQQSFIIPPNRLEYDHVRSNLNKKYVVCKHLATYSMKNKILSF